MIKNRLVKYLNIFSQNLDTHNEIIISKNALLHNVRFYETKTKLPIFPVLKSNAYGHGIREISLALRTRKFPYVAVDGYFEALMVRSHSDAPILVMGAILPQNYSKLNLKNIAYVVKDEMSLRLFGGLDKKITIHLEINTGMNRYGINPMELTKIIALIKNYKNLTLEGVMTHLADSDGVIQANVDKPIKIFDESVAKILSSGLRPKWFHAAQSSGCLRIKSKYANVSRIGIGLYGINPFSPTHPKYKECRSLKPAMEFTSTLTQINDLKKGDSVGYNYDYTASKPMRIGVIPAGYFEGVRRELSNKGELKVRNKYLPMLGKICMNHTMFDLKNLNLKIGEKVVVYSKNPADKNSVNGISKRFAVSPYLILSNMSAMVRRVIVD